MDSIIVIVGIRPHTPSLAGFLTLVGTAVTIGIRHETKSYEWVRIIDVGNPVIIVVWIRGHSHLATSRPTLVGPAVLV